MGLLQIILTNHIHLIQGARARHSLEPSMTYHLECNQQYNWEPKQSALRTRRQIGCHKGQTRGTVVQGNTGPLFVSFLFYVKGFFDLQPVNTFSTRKEQIPSFNHRSDRNQYFHPEPSTISWCDSGSCLQSQTIEGSSVQVARWLPLHCSLAKLANRRDSLASTLDLPENKHLRWPPGLHQLESRPG
jgi:hypothetical protein